MHDRKGCLVCFIREGQAVVSAIIHILLGRAVCSIAIGVDLIIRTIDPFKIIRRRSITGIGLGRLRLGNADPATVVTG